MHVIVAGLNHKTAPIELRERTAFLPEKWSQYIQQLQALPDVVEILPLSTCNRSELYVLFANEIDEDCLWAWWAEHSGVSQEDLRAHGYRFLGKDAILHMVRVAVGLDSMAIGEPQVFGQLKDAFQNSKQHGGLGLHFGRLFQRIASLVKQVRTTTAIGTHTISVAFAAASMVRHFYAGLQSCTALLIGSGDTMQHVSQHLKGLGVERFVVASRTLENAEKLALQCSGSACTLSDLPEFLPKADFIFSAAASELPLVTFAMMQQAVLARKHRPVLVVDLAVPRNVDPHVSQLEDVFLYCVDDLQKQINQNLKMRIEAAQQAELLIAEKVAQLWDWWVGQKHMVVVKNYREFVNQVHEEELLSAKLKLKQGIAAEKVVDELARAMTNKLTHVPTVVLRQAVQEGKHDWLGWLRDLARVREKNF